MMHNDLKFSTIFKQFLSTPVTKFVSRLIILCRCKQKHVSKISKSKALWNLNILEVFIMQQPIGVNCYFCLFQNLQHHKRFKKPSSVATESKRGKRNIQRISRMEVCHEEYGREKKMDSESEWIRKMCLKR